MNERAAARDFGVFLCVVLFLRDWGLPSVIHGVGELAFFAGFYGDGELDLVGLGFGEGV